MMASYVGTIVLYVLDLFEFDQATLGLFMFVVGFFLAFNQAFLPALYQTLWRAHDAQNWPLHLRHWIYRHYDQ